MNPVTLCLIILAFLFVIGGFLTLMGWLFGESQGGYALSNYIRTKAEILKDNAECDREIKRADAQIRAAQYGIATDELK